MDDAPLDLDLAPENLLELLHSHAMPQDGQRFRNGLDVRTLDEMCGDVLEWVGPRTKVLRADKVRDPQTKRPTIWQLLEPLHKIKSQSLLRRKAETAGVDAAALSSAELAERPKEAILQLHIERLTSSGNSPARSELHELHSTLEAVRLEARTENHYLLICAASAPTPGITIQCLKGFAESIAAFQAEVAQEIAQQLESARASQSPEDGGGSSGGGGPGSRLSTPRGVQPVGEEETGLPPVEIPVTTLAQRIVDIDVAIEAAKDAMKKDVLRKRRGVLERRLVELKDDKPARQVQAKRDVPWARGLEEPPRQPKDLGPRGGGVVLVYDQEQRIRLGVTEMGDPVPGENRDGRSSARRMFDKHTISMTRIRQLAEPEHVAMALTGTKFNNGGLEAEREEARGWLHQWASIGWGLTAAVELMWQGEREFTKLSSACEDRLTRPLLQLILDAELGRVKRLPPPPAAAAAAAASEGGGGGGGSGGGGGGGGGDLQRSRSVGSGEEGSRGRGASSSSLDGLDSSGGGGGGGGDQDDGRLELVAAGAAGGGGRFTSASLCAQRTAIWFLGEHSLEAVGLETAQAEVQESRLRARRRSSISSTQQLAAAAAAAEAQEAAEVAEEAVRRRAPPPPSPAPAPAAPAPAPAAVVDLLDMDWGAPPAPAASGASAAPSFGSPFGAAHLGGGGGGGGGGDQRGSGSFQQFGLNLLQLEPVLSPGAGPPSAPAAAVGASEGGAGGAGGGGFEDPFEASLSCTAPLRTMRAVLLRLQKGALFEDWQVCSSAVVCVCGCRVRVRW